MTDDKKNKKENKGDKESKKVDDEQLKDVAGGGVMKTKHDTAKASINNVR